MQIVLKILSESVILASLKGLNSVRNVQKIMCNNLNVDLVHVNA